MIKVKFRYTGKSAFKEYEYTKSIKDSTLGGVKPCSGVVYGDTIDVNKTNLKSFVKSAGKLLDDDGVLEVESNVVEFLKEKKNGDTEESKTSTEAVSE